jgi:phage baseplate assembly protein W
VSTDTDVYGKDILHDGSDFTVSAQSDYATVEGERNLHAALYRRLTVRPGEYRFKPNYGAGLGTYAKKKMTKTIRDEMTHRVTEQVAQEKRVEEVLEIAFERDDALQMNTLRLKVKAFGRTVTFAPMTFAETA